jgi:hypothetical protein
MVEEKNKLKEFFINAEDGQFSASRGGIIFMVGMMIVMDMVSLYMMLAGTFHPSWLTPICTMNSATVGSLALAYYSSNKG